MESDFYFKFDNARVFSGWAGLTARRAVLRPLFGKSKGREQIVKHTCWCLMAWRKRVSELVAAGAICAHRRNWEKNARNCQPAFVVGAGHQWTCHGASFCPFCYARAVAQLWRAAERSFAHCFGLEHSPYWLLERRYRMLVPLMKHEDLLAIQGNYQNAATKRRQLARFYNAVGGYGCLRVEPTSTPGNWSFSARQIFKVPAGGNYVARPGGEIVIVHETPTRALLSAAIARTCRYPKLLLRAPIANVVPILDAQSRLKARTTAMLGDFRNGEMHDY